METKFFFQWQPRHLNFLLICSCYLTPQISFCTGGSLSEVLESNRRTGTRMSESDFKQVLLHVAQGLKLIHSQNLVHLDIKPGQSLVNSLSSSILKNSRLLSESKICVHHLVNRSVKVNNNQVSEALGLERWHGTQDTLGLSSGQDLNCRNLFSVMHNITNEN